MNRSATHENRSATHELTDAELDAVSGGTQTTPQRDKLQALQELELQDTLVSHY
jgi:bacteriocin-like protein